VDVRGDSRSEELLRERGERERERERERETGVSAECAMKERKFIFR